MLVDGCARLALNISNWRYASCIQAMRGVVTRRDASFRAALSASQVLRIWQLSAVRQQQQSFISKDQFESAMVVLRRECLASLAVARAEAENDVRVDAGAPFRTAFDPLDAAFEHHYANERGSHMQASEIS